MSSEKIIDATDTKILYILQEKARIPNTEVARQVGMAPSAVLERIRKLERTGIIDGYEVRLNPQRFGRRVVAFVRIQMQPGANADALEQELIAIPEVQEVHLLTGLDDYLVKVRVADNTALGCLVRDKFRTLTGVNTIHSEVALATLKETLKIPLHHEER